MEWIANNTTHSNIVQANIMVVGDWIRKPVLNEAVFSCLGQEISPSTGASASAFSSSYIVIICNDSALDSSLSPSLQQWQEALSLLWEAEIALCCLLCYQADSSCSLLPPMQLIWEAELAPRQLLCCRFEEASNTSSWFSGIHCSFYSAYSPFMIRPGPPLVPLFPKM